MSNWGTAGHVARALPAFWQAKVVVHRVPLRIVHVVPHFDNCGNGVVNAAVDLASTQARLGMTVALAGSGEGSFRGLLEREGVTVQSLPATSAHRLLSYLLCVRNLIGDFNPDIVHAHMVPGAIIGHLLRRGTRYKMITSVHNSRRFGTKLMSLGDLVVCVSNYLAQEMRSRGVSSRKLRVVHNGPLGSPRLPPLPVVGHRLQRPAIVTIAEPATHKGLGDLISAFALLAEKQASAHLYILGDGAGRTGFERQAQASGCRERITFCGFVADPAAYLQNADIFVLASHREGFGLALVEARRSCCAIIASDVGGIPEVLDCGAAGILVPVRSPERLAFAMQDLIENPVRRNNYRVKAGCNLEWLSCLRAATETTSVYTEALGRKPADDRECSAIVAG